MTADKFDQEVNEDIRAVSAFLRKSKVESPPETTHLELTPAQKQALIAALSYGLAILEAAPAHWHRDGVIPDAMGILEYLSPPTNPQTRVIVPRLTAKRNINKLLRGQVRFYSEAAE